MSSQIGNNGRSICSPYGFVGVSHDSGTNITTFQQGGRIIHIQGEGISRRRIGELFLVDGRAVVYGDPRILSVTEEATSSVFQNQTQNMTTLSWPGMQNSVYEIPPDSRESSKTPTANPLERTSGVPSTGGFSIGRLNQNGRSIQIPNAEGPFARGYECSMQIEGYQILRNTETGAIYKIKGRSTTFLQGNLVVDGVPISGINDPRVEATHEYDHILRFY